MLTVTVADVGADEPAAGAPAAGGVVVPDPMAPMVAVTVAVVDVRSGVAATPDASVVRITESSVPAGGETETGAPPSALPLMSNTDAEINEEPPAFGMRVG